MTIEVDIAHSVGAFSLDASFTAESGLVSLFGRSGSGKTTIVNIIAGLVRPRQGRVVVDGHVLLDTKRGIFLPPHQRRLGYVFQEGRLFPHLSVKQNLLFGSWFANGKRKLAELERVVDLLGIGHLLDRQPSRLSGGEKQRVAIGRALLASPRLVLMDEPLVSLDESRKQEILPYLERLRDDMSVPVIYVSHSVAEVARLSNFVVLLSGGKVLAAGPTVEVMQRLDLSPATGGEEAGAVIEAVIQDHDDTYGLSRLVSRAGTWRVPRLEVRPGTRLRMMIRARDVMIALQPPDHVSALNVIPAIVQEIGSMSTPVAEVKLDCNGEALVARLTRFSVERLALKPGAAVFAIVKSVAFDRNTVGGAWRDTGAADADTGRD